MFDTACLSTTQHYILNFAAVVDSPRSKSIFGVPGIVAPVQSQGIEYYDDFVNGAPFSAGSPAASAYIPTAPYPASVYGRPPFWIRLQRWNPFSRLVE